MTEMGGVSNWIRLSKILKLLRLEQRSLCSFIFLSKSETAFVAELRNEEAEILLPASSHGCNSKCVGK